LAAIASAAASRARSRYGWSRIAGETELLYRRVLARTDAGTATDAVTTTGLPTATVPGGRS
ncbi:MAG: hypothetical protein WCC38_09325, partial [Pseudonocardiaceae bacterium]